MTEEGRVEEILYAETLSLETTLHLLQSILESKNEDEGVGMRVGRNRSKIDITSHIRARRNCIDRGAWLATVHKVAKSRTRLK